MAMSAPFVLYKWPECWGLPSISAACLQAEAYIRFTQTEFEVVPCSTTSKSPTGQLPALEKGADIAGTELDEFAAARSVITFAKKHIKDLDQLLSAGSRAELLAFATTIDAKLNIATTVTTWCENKGFVEYKKAAYGNQLPFPLSYLIPWSKQRETRKKFAATTPEQVYEEAGEVIVALADRLRAAGTPFFFGKQPSSLDALVFGHLMYYRYSPAVAPYLHDKVCNHVVLCDYLDNLLKLYFVTPAPVARPAGEAGPSASWSEAAKGQKGSRSSSAKVEPTKAEQDFSRNSRYWLLGVGVTMAAYVLLSGRYIQIGQLADMLGDAADDGDDEDEDDE